MKKPIVILLQPYCGYMDRYRDRPMSPLSLIVLATFLPKDYEVRLIDQRIERWWKSNLKRQLRNPRCLAIGITVRTGPMIGHALKMAKAVRQYSSLPIVWGGYHVSLNPEQSIINPYVDYLVQGEGEYTFKILLDSLQRKDQHIDIPGVWLKRNGQIVSPRQFCLGKEEKRPIPPYEAIPIHRYLYSYLGFKTLDYLSSRGCPHECNFCCNRALYQRQWLAKPATVVLNELTILKDRYHFQCVYFVDDNFFVDKKRAFEIIHGIKKIDLKYTLAGVDIQTIASFSEEELTCLEESGLLRLCCGVESIDSETRKRLGKWGNTQQVLKQLKRLANRKFIVLSSLIIGFPFENEEDIRSSVDFFFQLNRIGTNFRCPHLFIYTPFYTGGPLGEIVRQQQIAIPKTLEEWAKYDYTSTSLFATKPRLKKIINQVAFLSRFNNPHSEYGSRLWVKILYQLYAPIARYRLSNFKLSWPIEKKLSDLFFS